MSAIASCAALAACVVIFYGLVLGRSLDDVRWPTQLVLGRFPGARRYSSGEVEAVVRLGMGGLLQLLFCAGLIAVLDVGLGQIQPAEIQPELVALGMALGIGEAALATFVGYVGMQVGLAVAPGRTPTDADDWLALSRSGWMRLFFQAAEIAPAVAVALSFAYIAVEETVFRGVVITVLRDSSAALALAASVLLFALTQTFRMPSWHSAMFPVLGAVVVGVVHGLLFLAVPSILPLIVAHFVFFVVAVA
ncbi:MAG TPA: CPBP family glutamic-type intramembrane protease [Thermoleophilaceae bacterium]|nr:CPBP family glutamic-type intramembrane protease [Thermoleophilaceae bacterium]